MQYAFCYNLSVIYFILLGGFSFVLCFGLTYMLIAAFRHLGLGQSIREEGPRSHLSKAGTPTMGGVAIVISAAAACLIFVDFDARFTAVLLLMLAYGLIGFLDDLLGLLHGKNAGLSPSQKMGLQIFAALAFGSYLIFLGHEASIEGLLRTIGLGYAWLYLPFIVFLTVGFSNAANLTDGLDGLLAGCLIFSFGALTLISLLQGNIETAALCFAISASLGAFLVFNRNPARIFMGDTGSLALGALLCAAAVILHKELLLLLIGGVYVAETVSVMAQVAYFKLTGKRLLRMSPLHHHFELSGAGEKRTVAGFWLASFVLAVLAVVIG